MGEKVSAGSIYRADDLENSAELYSRLKLFPTPFKGIYYAPYESEREGWFITDPLKVAFEAAKAYLGTDRCYIGLGSALYLLRVIWNPVPLDIINEKMSRVVERKLPEGNYWRAKVIKKIAKDYPAPVRFHRMENFSMKGIRWKGRMAYSGTKKTKKDAEYLCRKGSKIACEALSLMGKGV